MENVTKVIELTRDDLIEFKKFAPIGDIELYDFKAKCITIKQIEEADLIKFRHEDGVTILKDRHQNY